MLNNRRTTTPLPTWWRDEHETSWQRVKGAVRRDWEQTRSDLTGGREGTDLNQKAGDTFKQAFGSGPLPPDAEPNPMNPEEVRAHVRRAARQVNREVESLADRAERSIAQAQVAREWHRWDHWGDIEVPLRYGHAAASHYGASWDHAIENEMRKEWADLHPDHAWDDVRDTVRRGWDQGKV